MAAHERDRIDELEARVESLEARLRSLEGSPTGASRPQPPPPPPPPPVPSAPAPRPAAAVTPPPLPKLPPLPPLEKAPEARAKKSRDLEELVGLKILGRVGVAAVVIAAAYFGKLGWDRIGPTGRVLCIYLAAALMLAAGLLLRARVRPTYTGLLCGGAVALSYTAGVVAKIGYDLIGATPAMLLLIASTALGQWLGRLLRLEVIATAALGGGYLAPVLVGDPSDTPTTLLVYLLALHTWAAWTEHRWRWHFARAGAVFGTASIMAAWFLANAMPSELAVVLHVEAALLGLVAPELIAVFRADVARPRWLLVMAGLWVVQIGLVLFSMPHAELAGYGLIAGGAWLGLGWLLARRDGVAPRVADLARVGGTLLAFGALTVWNRSSPWWDIFDKPSWPRLVALLGAGGLLLALRRRLGAADLGIAVAAVLALFVAVSGQTPADARLLGVAALLLPATLVGFGSSRTGTAAGLATGALLTMSVSAGPLLFTAEDGAWTAAAFVATSAWLGAGALASRHRDHVTLHTATAIVVVLATLAWVTTTFHAGLAFADYPLVFNWRFSAALALLSAVAATRRFAPSRPLQWPVPLALAAGLAVAYLAGLVELLHAVRDLASGWRGATVSVYSTVFAGGLLAAGFWKQNAAMRWVGLCGFLLVVLKVALLDLAALDTPLRVLVTGVLGVVLLVGAWGYARVQRRTGT